MEETHNNRVVGGSPESAGETFEQKVIRNVRDGGFAVYKTPEVVGGKTMIANIEWEDPEQVDKFFAFAKNLGSKIIYVSEREEESEDEENPSQPNQSKVEIVQIGFLHNSIMHHINLLEEDEDEEDEYDEDEDEEESEDEEGEEYEEDDSTDEHDEPVQETIQPQQPQTQVPQQQPTQQFSQPAREQPQTQVPPQQPTQQQPWPKPQF